MPRRRGPRAQRPEVAPTRLGPDDAVQVDGDLIEPIWQRAAVLGSLTQVEPVEGAEATQPTVVRLAYDADALYIAIECMTSPGRSARA